MSRSSGIVARGFRTSAAEPNHPYSDNSESPSLAARLGRAGMLLHRRLLLLSGIRADPVRPLRRPSPGPVGGVLVLQSGDNASTDYFIRSRLEAPESHLTWAVVDLDTPPGEVEMWPREGLLVIVCRYITSQWLRALEQNIDRLKGVVLFIDDDLPAMVRDRSIPAAARGRILRDHVRHAARLGAVASALWVSSPVLAGTATERPARILEPLPTESPRAPARTPPALVVYHGGPTHRREQAFVAEVAAALASRRPDIRFEITGDAGLERWAAGFDTVIVVPPTPWRTYRRTQSVRQAAIMLAPLFDTAVNRARAPVKFLDATRLGAVGLYADGPVYGAWVRDGVDGRLLPMTAAVWADEIEALIDAPGARFAMAKAAHDRVSDAFRNRRPLSLGDMA